MKQSQRFYDSYSVEYFAAFYYQFENVISKQECQCEDHDKSHCGIPTTSKTINFWHVLRYRFLPTWDQAGRS